MTSIDAPPRLTGIILAGGQSTRFGADKASALFQGRPMLQWVASALGEACDELVVVTARGQALPPVETRVPLRVVADEVPALGPLAGLAAGLGVARGELCFASSCDAPLLRPALVQLLASMARGYDVVCPEVAGRAQPLVAVYRRLTCLPAFRHQVERGNLKMTAALSGLRVRTVSQAELYTVDPALDSFVNANRPAVLGELAERLRVRTG